MITDESKIRVPLSETAEERRARMKELARRGGLASRANQRNSKRLRDLTGRILNAPIPLNGKLGEILYKVGIKTTDKTSAIEGIMGVFTAKALSGDLKAAQFVLECAGWSGNSQLLMARVAMTERMAENPDGFTIEAAKRSEHILDLHEIDQEAQRMGLYETMEQVKPEDTQSTDAEVVK